LCYEYLHKFDSALVFHQKAINVNKGWEAAYQNKLGTLLLKFPDTSEAHKFINEITSITDDKHMEDQIILDIYDGKYFDALTKAKKAKPDDFSYEGLRLVYLGNISLLLDDKPGAEKYYSDAVESLRLDLRNDSLDTRIHGLIGVALAGQGKKEAVKEGENALRIARKENDKLLETETILSLAEINTRLGNFNDAIENIEIVLKSPSLFSTNILQLDPVWKPLISRPEIKTLLAKYDSK
jgi:tetratricopeptide (TPR) repeat protein